MDKKKVRADFISNPNKLTASKPVKKVRLVYDGIKNSIMYGRIMCQMLEGKEFRKPCVPEGS